MKLANFCLILEMPVFGKRRGSYSLDSEQSQMLLQPFYPHVSARRKNSEPINLYCGEKTSMRVATQLSDTPNIPESTLLQKKFKKKFSGKKKFVEVKFGRSRMRRGSCLDEYLISSKSSSLDKGKQK